MTINSPDAMPDDEPQEGATGTKGGGIPKGGKGIGIGAGGEPNTFEPEEGQGVTEDPQGS